MSVGVGSQYYSAFNPLDIGGCSLWLDAADQSTLTLSGTNVTQWRDKSGSGFNASNTSNYPTFSNSNINFVTSNQLKLSPFIPAGTQNVTLAIVWKTTSVSNAGFQSIIENSPNQFTNNGGWWRFMTYQYGFGGRNADYYGLNEYGGNPIPLSNMPTFTSNSLNLSFITQYSSDGTNFTISNFHNGSLYGTQTYTGAIATATQGTMGLNANGESFNGSIAEVLIFLTQLSDSQRQQIEGYLSRKWFRSGSISTIVPFAPTQISGCQLWLDAADSTSLTLSGSNVTQWNDKSGNGYNATVQTGNTTYSSNGVVFTGAQMLQTPLSSVMPTQTFFAVLSSASSAANMFAVAVKSSNLNTGYNYIINSNQQTVTRYGGTAVMTGSTISQGTRYLYNATINSGSSSFLYANGSQTGSNVSTPTISGSNATVGIGAYYYPTVDPGPTGFFTGTINELLIFNNVLTTLQRQQVEGYLAMKWGLQSSLPSTHPYALLGVPSTHPYYSIPPITRQFAPVDIPSCALWLDAADPNSMAISTSATGSATLSQYVTTSAQNVSYNIPFTSLSSFIGGTTFMNGTAINFGNGTPGVFAPSASNGVWYAIDSGYTKAVKVQFALSGTTLTVQGLSAGYGATAGVSPLNSGAVNDVCYNTYSPTTIATSSSTASYGVASFTMNYTVAGANIVSQWNDKSGNGRNTSSLTGTAVLVTNSVNAKQGVYFNGTSYFTGPFSYSSNTLSWFVVGTVESDGESFGRLLSLGASGQYDFDSALRMNGLSRNGTTTELITYRSTQIGQGMNIVYATPFVMSGVIDGTSNYPYLNGTLATGTATSGNFGFTTYGISGSFGLNVQRNKGYIFEVLIYSNALTTTQRQQVEGYLAKKWGLVGSTSTIVPFAPTQISGCALWLDAADSTTVTGTNPITNWSDKSGTGKTVTFVNTNTYTNGVSVNTSGSSSAFFKVNVDFRKSITPYVNMFIVHTWSGSGLNTQQALWGQDDGGGFNRIQFLSVPIDANASYGLYYGNSSPYTLRAPTLNTGSRLLYSVNLAYLISSSTFISVNGNNTSSVTEAVASPQTTTQSVGFASQNTTGGSIGTLNFHEIIIYTSTTSNITAAQRQQVEGYLANKWGLSSSLPSTHPYARTGLPSTHPFISRNPRITVFNPRQVSGCTLWLDAADPNGNGSAISSGTTITTWKDKSGNGNHVTGSSGTTTYLTTGISKLGSVYFNSSYFTGGLSSNFTGTTIYCFIVASINSNTTQFSRLLSLGRPGVNDYDSASTCIPFVRYTGANQVYAGNNNSATARINITYGSPFLSQTYFTASAIGNNVNGGSFSTAATTSSFNLTSYALGINTNTADTASPYVGEICEIICYFGTSLTTQQAQQIEGYLAWKWGLNRGSLSTLTTFTPTQITGCALWLDSGDSNSMTLQGIATFSQYITTTDQSVSYTGTLSSLSSLTGGTCVMNGPAINFGNGSPGVFAPSAIFGVWYAIDTGYTKVVKLQFTLAGTTLYVKALSAGYNASGGISPTNSGATNDTAYATYSPAAIATSGSSGSYGVSSFTMYFTSSSGPYVTQWRDKSGNARNTSNVSGTPSLTTNSAISKQGVYFNGSSFTGAFSYSSNTLSWFVAGSMESGSAASARLLSLGIPGTLDYDNTTKLVALARVSSTNEILPYRNANLASGVLVTYGTPFVFSSVIDGTSNYPYLNGTAATGAATSGNFGFSQYAIANAAGTNTVSFVGHIFEVLIYSNALTTFQRQQVEGYLANKWGTNSSTLPFTHPYKVIKP